LVAKQITGKLYDLALASPLMALNGLGIYGLYPRMLAEATQLLGTFSLEPALNLLAQFATLAFLTLQILLFAIRRLPERKANGILPRWRHWSARISSCSFSCSRAYMRVFQC